MSNREKSVTDFTGQERVVCIVSILIGALTDGLGLMLAFGVAHGCRPQVPTFGYWACVFFAFVIAQVLGSGLTSTSMRIRKLGRLEVNARAYAVQILSKAYGVKS